MHAFDQSKPLFTFADRDEAKTLIEKSLSFICDTCNRLSVRLERELVKFEQRCCSGVQFILDELDVNVYDLLEGPGSCVKECIKNCKEFEIDTDYQIQHFC